MLLVHFLLFRVGIDFSHHRTNPPLPRHPPLGILEIRSCTFKDAAERFLYTSTWHLAVPRGPELLMSLLRWRQALHEKQVAKSILAEACADSV